MHNSIKKSGFLIIVFIFICINSACSMDQTFGDPDTILNDALSHLNEFEQIGLFGTSEAASTGYTFIETDTLYTEYNQQWVKVDATSKDKKDKVVSDMLLNMEELQKVKKQVTFDTARSNANITVINIDIEEEDIEAVIKRNLMRKLEQIEQSFVTKASFGEQHQLDKRNAVEQAGGKLKIMLNTLKVKAQYQMGVDLHTHAPLTLQVMTDLEYKIDGLDKQETIRGSYEFRVFDKDVVIPQTL
jgi:hypothetical protein